MQKEIVKTDKTDVLIMSILRENSRVTDGQIAQQLRTKGIGITNRAVNYRINRLLKNNIIKFTIQENAEALGKKTYIAVMKFKPGLSLMNLNLFKSLIKMNVGPFDASLYVSYGGKYQVVLVSHLDTEEGMYKRVDRTKEILGDNISELEFWQIDRRIDAKSILDIASGLKKLVEGA